MNADRQTVEHRKLLEKALDAGLPSNIARGIANYSVYRLRPGSFLSAVIAEDTALTSLAAGPTSTELLEEITQFVRENLSLSIRGSRKRINEHINEGLDLLSDIRNLELVDAHLGAALRFIREKNFAANKEAAVDEIKLAQTQLHLVAANLMHN